MTNLNTCKIGVVTPLKNELLNIELLIDSVSEQSVPIEYWIIIQNGSTDGSKEFLEGISSVKNVANFKVINYELPNEKYELGLKYANVVNQGFMYLKEIGAIDNNLDYIGILDADCFPSKNYYEKLIAFMASAPQIGISSGIGRNMEGKLDKESRSWVRGNCRLWTIDCFKNAGYVLGPSADTLSVCKAELKGWKAIPKLDLIYQCRDMGTNVNHSYYGYSAYYRGTTPFYALLKTIKHLVVGEFTQGKRYFKGYFNAFRDKKEQIKDKDIYNYFSNYLLIKAKKKLCITRI